MAIRVWKRVLLHFLCVILVFVSPASIALSQKILDQILKQSPRNMNMGLMALAAVFVILLLLVIIIKVQLGRSRKKQKTQYQELTNKQSLLNDFKVGMLHINLAGEIIFANRVAAFFLGSNEDKLINIAVVEVFDDEVQRAISAALVTNQYVSLQTYVAASKRYLQLGVSKQSDINNGIASVISVTDISNYQYKIEQQLSELHSLNQGLLQSGLAQLTIDFDEDTFSCDQLFADLLLAAAPLTGNLNQFKQMLNSNQVFEWEQALEVSKNQHHLDISCEFLSTHNSQLSHQGSEPKEAQYENTVPLRLIGHSRNINTKGETTRLNCFVQNQSELKEQKRLQQASQQQIHTLLATSPNGVYLLDQQGKFINCNLAFESMFKQKLSKIKGKNIQELDILPTDLSRLHTQNSSNFSSVNAGHETEFEWQLADEVVHTLKLKLKFFCDKHKKRAGVVAVIQDVTELKMTRNQLEQERKHFMTILDLAPVAVATIDAEDRIIRANIAMTDRLGLSERELKKDTFYQLFNDSSKAGKAAKKIHLSGRLRGFSAHLKGKNGELHPSELHVDCLNKATQEYLCWIIDSTKEQFHQDKFDGLLQHSSMPMAILGEQGFSKLNPAACAFFNIQNEHELLGSTPFAAQLNPDQEASNALERHLTKIKLDGQAKSLQWEHQVGQISLPCQATYVPMYKGQDFDSILCIWTDLTDLKLADAARIEALNLHQAAEKEVAQQQQLLQNSQDQLATKAKNLADIESRLQTVEEDLSEKQSEFSYLQQAHQSVTDNLQKLQEDYNQSRTQLFQAKNINNELASQLAESSVKVKGLQAQRIQISDALQHSQAKYKTAQQELSKSERHADDLQQEQLSQQKKMNDFVSQIDGFKASIQQKDQQINQVGGQINALQCELTSAGNTSEKLRELLVNQRKASEQAEEQRRKLEQTCKIAESQLTNKVRHVEHLQHEMHKFEEMSNQQKGDMQQHQSQLEHELETKQQQLQQTQQVLNETKQVAEQEKVAKQQQQNQLAILQQELTEMELHSQQQQQEMTNAEQQWQTQQQQVQQELASKQRQLQDSEHTLQQAKEQNEREKADKEQQLALFEKLHTELADVEQRNAQQQQHIAQRDGEYQQQQDHMQQELKAKQQQLQHTQHNLSEVNQHTAAQKQQQRTLFEKLQGELSEMQARNVQQQQQMAKSEGQWQLQQQKVQQELMTKQQQLNHTQQLLSQTKQQTEAQKTAEKTEKVQQQALFEKLQHELAQMEQQSTLQQQKIAQSDQNWQKQQQALKDEVKVKRQQLRNTQDNLDDIKRQADAEKLAHLAQQQKLEQLTVELTDVENRAVKQKQMIEGSDEQWRKHHDEIEQQKLQLQQALIEAEKQNGHMQQKLKGKLEQLQEAESQVTETQSGEQKLQEELNHARDEAQQLQQRIQQQEAHETQLQMQLEQQQQRLHGSEKNIHFLEEKQAQLTEKLQAVQQDYSNSKESLSSQHHDHATLAQQLQKLEQDLHHSESQLSDKESALQQAKQELGSNQVKLVEQENALLCAHKEELQQAIKQQQQAQQKGNTLSDIAKIAIPDNPEVWFDLLSYLQSQNVTQPLPYALNELMDELENGIKETHKALEHDDVAAVLRGARQLVMVANKVNSEALTDVVTRLEADCRHGLVDNISISWPTVKRSLNNTLRVIYSHLNY